MVAEANNITKQKSRQIAAMKFLGIIYPKTTTWETLKKEVMAKKKPLSGLLVDLHQVKQIQTLTTREEYENDMRRLKSLESIIKSHFQSIMQSDIEKFTHNVKNMSKMLSDKVLDS